MSTFSDALVEEVGNIVTTQWDTREGRVVPEIEKLGMGNDRVELDAVLLYADLADSTEMAVKDQEIAAEVFKSYLRGVTKLISASDGAVRSFDGDRVMGVFVGDRKNTNAALCGLKINWFFRNALAVKFKSFYGDKVSGFNFDQTVGIDASEIYVARAGIRANNDLIWVGRAPNVAAKLSGIRNGTHKTLITKTVYDRLAPDGKISGSTKENRWVALTWEAGKVYGVPQLYGSVYSMIP